MFLKKYAQLPKNLFGLLYWNTLSVFVVIFIIIGLLALFGVRPVEFNGEPTYGILGLIMSLIMAPIMALVATLTTWLFAIAGNFILRLFVKRDET